MRTDTPKTIYLKDYRPFPFDVMGMDMKFDLYEDYALVTSRASYKRTDPLADQLFLNGEDLELVSIKIDDIEIETYVNDDAGITLGTPAQECFMLEIVTKIFPQNNTRLEGLYKSGGNFCSQCEAEGFRRITYFPDRPDVLTTYNVRVEADKTLYPVLLSNGNRVDSGDLDNGRHFSVWHDPHPKPCYLFALVAGDLTQIHDHFTTKSGRHVDLYIYVRKGDEGQCAHAMASIINSMRWDEKIYGLEYDLDLFNVVAVSDFNMGAMENKSLNIFNTALVLAHQDTATDSDFMRVEGVIAHEYFHNWSGNRVTCRDWFQLSLKEGLTVFRDQEFSADMHSRDVQRIDDVTHLRRFQFAEDAGPLAHPIRPDNYIEINNFYTMTIYEKGAEIIRMLHTILGADDYRKGTDLYFERHDGQAVTCDDFVKALEDASGKNLKQFRLWYSQAGTPELSVRGEYDSAEQSYKVTLSQNIPDTVGQIDKNPMVIPVSIGLIGDNGDDLIKTRTLMLNKAKQEFVIKDVAQNPVPSFLRGFSAPVKLNHGLSDDELAFLMVHDSDGFNRYESGQTYALRVVNALIDGGDISCSSGLVDSFGKILDEALDNKADKSLVARALSMPDIGYIGQQRSEIDPPAIYQARKKLLDHIFEIHGDNIQTLYDENRSPHEFAITRQAMGQRSLQARALALLSHGEDDEIGPRALAQYTQSHNMTDRVSALCVLANSKTPERDKAFTDFYDRFKGYPLVIDKWFALQSAAMSPSIMADLKALRYHNDFNIKNPNRVRSLYSSFAMNNPVSFHAADGSGYEFLRDAIIDLNDINPQIAARLLTPMREWRRYTPDRQDKMKNALSEILKIKNIMPDVYEIASKSLNA